LRTFTVAAEPTPLYRRLCETAEAAFDAVTGVIRHGTTMQEIVDATSVIEDTGSFWNVGKTKAVIGSFPRAGSSSRLCRLGELNRDATFDEQQFYTSFPVAPFRVVAVQRPSKVLGHRGQEALWELRADEPHIGHNLENGINDFVPR
jgi:hypothetical protein